MGVVPRTYWPLLLFGVILNIGAMAASTVTGGLLVDAGQRYVATGRLSSWRMAAMNIASLAAGPLGGVLASMAFGWTALISGVLFLSLAPITMMLLSEPRANQTQGSLRAAGRQLVGLFRSPTLLAAAAMLFFVQLAPGFTTPLLFWREDKLHFSTAFMGTLDMVNYGFGLLASIIYVVACRRMTLKPLLFWAVILWAVTSFLYLGYYSHKSAMAIEAAAGLTFALAQLPLFDLAARATPKGSEALAYSLMMAVWNISQSISDVVGSWLFARCHIPFMHLIWINGATTLLAVIVIPFLPQRLVSQREGDRT